MAIEEQLKNIENAISNLDTTSETQITLSEDDYYLFHMMFNQLERIANALEKTKEEA
tara:strand:+ start:103 stop:273 length:171 start_codon:yes stop_codon:yes gene_type:complete